MPVIQISRIQHRSGTSGELPDALATGEIGFTTDTGEVFIGAGDHARVADRKSYPYQNIKILTEFDVQYGMKGDVYYHGPLKQADLPQGAGTLQFPLFAYDAEVMGKFGRYDYSLTSTQGCQVGELNVILHGTTLRVTSTADTLGNIGGQAFTFTGQLVGGRVILNVTWDPTGFGTQKYRLHISGREWSAIPPV